MGWPQQDHDKRDRAKIAHELDRREFWKQCFVIAKQQGSPTDDAALVADYSLKVFEGKFPPLCGTS